jgi:alpha-tubulin suppressor-like RCC1 family protein
LVCAGTLDCSESRCEQVVTALALGADHSCALRDSGEVWCWGRNDYLQLGNATTTGTQWTPLKADVESAKQIDAGQSRTCAITTAKNALTCWGALPLLQGTSGPDSSGFTDIGVLSPTFFRGMAIGGSANCWLNTAAAHCWGYNTNDALSTSVPINAGRSYAMQVNTPFSEPKQIDVGARVTCVVSEGGHVSCWGGEANPNLRVIEKANGSPLSGVTAVSVSLAENATSPADSACALTDSGNIWCWGTNSQGELGNPALTDSSSLGAVQVTDSTGAPAENVVEVAVGAYHACARLDSGLVVCWGRTDLLGSGRAGSAIRRSPVEVKDLTDAIEIKAGTLHTCARRRTGQVVCWGSNGFGQLGVDPTTTPTSNVPVNVTNLP